MASLPLTIKVFLCLLVVALSKGADPEESGQYSPELYEKPYETTEVEEVTTEVAETEPPEKSEEPQEVPEVVKSADYTPAAPTTPGAPGDTGAPPLVPAIPYPLLYSQFPAPLIYPAPQYLRIAAGFPTVIV